MLSRTRAHLRPAARPVLALLVLTALSACTAGDDPPEQDAAGAEATVQALAEALVDGDFDAVAFSDDTPEQVAAEHAAVVEGLGEVEPTVVPGVVEEEGDAARATLVWSWPLGPQGEEWTYDSPVRLTRSGSTWQVAWDRPVIEPSLTGGTVLDLTPIAARRGDILGAQGLALVTARPVVRVGLDKARVPAGRVGAAARAMARLVDIEVGPYVERAKAAGAKAFVEAGVFRPAAVPREVALNYNTMPGGMLVSDDVPLGPTPGFAAPILGSVGEVTAEMIEAQPDLYEVGDEAGLSGLQQRYDEQLQGRAGVVVDAVASDGKERELWRADAQQGTALKTTLDLDLQSAAERLLADVGPASALVALRPSDGAILAAANGPGTDGYNMATFGQFAPGSTFKAVSSLALLRAGLTPTTTVSCDRAVVVDGKRFENYDDYPSGALGSISWRTALANSCNTAVIAERDRLGETDLFDAAASLGLGIDHDLGFPAYFGQVPPPAGETEKAADLIGQGRVLASPMAMATVIASVQSGRLVVPRLLQQVEVTEPETLPLTEREGDTLRQLLRAVVTEGSGRGLADVPGPPVIAKTGTAEFERGGSLRTHAWMIAAQGDVAVAAFVELGASGSRTAGPLLEGLLRAAR